MRVALTKFGQVKTNSQLPIFSVRLLQQRWMTSNENANNETKKEEETKSEESIDQVKAKLVETQTKLEAITKERDQAKENILYTLAENENVRRIAQKDIENAKMFAIQRFAKPLLDVADNLERAISSVPADLDTTKVDTRLVGMIEGVKMTEKTMLKAFAENGLHPYGSVGDMCDPNRYEALFHVPDASKPVNSVIQVLRRGFELNKRVLRAAQVGCASTPTTSSSSSSTEDENKQ